ncbi:hypothetical protein ACROYT_G026071 [Oculina patagonica]
MAGSVEARFDAAVNVVRSMPKKGAYQPSYDTMLKFYAFYKQAKEGECSESEPGFWDVVRKAKWKAWNGLGQMSKQEAMVSYVSELKQVMQNLPDGDEAAEFSEVLKSFYKLVYEGEDEKPPAILKVFENEEKAAEKIKVNGDFKSKGHHAPQHENVPNGYTNAHDVNGACEEFPVKVNGFPHRDSMDIRAGFPHRDSLALKSRKDYDLNGLNPVLIISSDELKEENDEELKEEEDDDDSGIQNGMSEVPPLTPSNAELLRPKGKSSAIMTSDESEEDEFCDTLDPEHLQQLQNGNHKEAEKLNLDDTLQRLDSAMNSNSSSSPEHATNSTLSESENSDLESDLKGSQLLTSTPYAKHVTFAVEGSDSSAPTVVNSDLSEVEPLVSEECFSEVTPVVENGHGSETSVVTTEYDTLTPFDQVPKRPAGILKSQHATRECGGGDANQQPPTSGRSHTGRTRQSQGARNREGSSTVSGVSRPPRGHRRRSDSDSEDELTSDHTSGPDYDSAGDEINDRILQALERLHQDMKSVLRRLGTMEEAVLSRQDAASRSDQPWWKAYIPSKPLLFLILWPFIVNIVFYYFRRRKNSQQR